MESKETKKNKVDINILAGGLFIITVVALLLIFILGFRPAIASKSVNDDRFQLLGSDKKYPIIYLVDTETSVLYVNGRGFSPLVQADGKPVLYHGEYDTSDDTKGIQKIDRLIAVDYVKCVLEFRILVDKETMVMYAYGATLEPMVDAEGKPLLFSGELPEE